MNHPRANHQTSPIDVSQALAQIDEIHGHLARTEVYRGTRAVVVAAGGLLALAGGVIEPHFVANLAGRGHVLFWIIVAVASAVPVAGEIALNYFAPASPLARRATRQVVEQLLPTLATGALVTTALFLAPETALAYLPALWALLFALGIFAARPYLPRAIGWVALFYLVAGAAQLFATAGGYHLPWGMPLTFGPGQLFAALVLYWNRERREHDPEN